MQSCSIHHCVLFFLTLTFTTAPVSAGVCPVLVKLHQSVTLPCEKDCSPRLAKWTLDSNRDVIFAQCNQTSCRSLVKGYEMSHDQYLKGDLSLTITKADYSMRKSYVCECGISDYVTSPLVIDTVFSAVQRSPGEDLILDLSVPEPVEVIYKSSDSADGEQICNVTQHRLQCKAEYTPRTSLSYPELTLRGVERSDSGIYTIRDMKNNRDIHVYAVSVAGLAQWEVAVIVITVLLLLIGLIVGVMVNRWKAAQELLEVERGQESVDDAINQVKLKNPKREQNEEKVEAARRAAEEAEKKINELEEQYRDNTKHSEHIRLFCDSRRDKMIMYKNIYAEIQSGALEAEAEKLTAPQMMEMMDEVGTTLEELRCEAYRRSRATRWLIHRIEFLSHLFIQRNSPTEVLQQTFIRVELSLLKIKQWCEKQREAVKSIKEKLGNEGGESIMLLETLVDSYEQRCEAKQEEMERYSKMLKLTPQNKPEEEERLNV